MEANNTLNSECCLHTMHSMFCLLKGSYDYKIFCRESALDIDLKNREKFCDRQSDASTKTHLQSTVFIV